MIKVKNLTKKYDGVNAVSDVSLSLPDGASMVIFGPSGCGKTTLLRLVAGLEMPDAGEIELDGQVASNSSRALSPHRRSIGFVFQAPALWPHLTIAQNILFGLKRFRKNEAKRRLQEVLELVFIEELADRYPDQVSGGQAKRASLGRALAPKPRRLLLDEPLTNLDTGLKDKLVAVINKYAGESGASLIYVTHDREEAAAVSDNILFMESGRLIR